MCTHCWVQWHGGEYTLRSLHSRDEFLTYFSWSKACWMLAALLTQSSSLWSSFVPERHVRIGILQKYWVMWGIFLISSYLLLACIMSCDARVTAFVQDTISIIARQLRQAIDSHYVSRSQFGFFSHWYYILTSRQLITSYTPLTASYTMGNKTGVIMCII